MLAQAFELPEPILDAALARLVGAEGEARERILAELVARHPEHAEPLRALSRALLDTDRLLARSFVPATACDPERIGAYRVMRRLGEGAFGVVYLCAQDEPIRRQVAVKVLRPGAGDAGTLARFEAERQMLVGFDHPGIAVLIDAGALPDGRPYFTMEHVDGVPITAYCDRHRLSIDARLLLYTALCDAVAHAHARGTVHRDLKPANVLVVERDGKPVPKIIDFGIAKALHPADRADLAMPTTAGRVIGTPGYMSPEQASGDPTAVDARADVFSLGVILYELLVGTMPWAGRAPIADTEPPRPSLRAQSERARIPCLAGMRATEQRMLVSRLRRELDWVVLKALSHARELRYQSARELADDVQRYLQGEAVWAGPPSAATRLRSVMRRHRAKVAIACALVVIGGAAIAVSSMFRRDALSTTAARLSDLDAAVRRLVARAFDPRLQESALGDDMRRDILRDALALHERAARERATEPEHRSLHVVVLNHLAEIHFHFGEYQQSIRLSLEAEQESGALAKLQPDRTAHRTARATAQRNLARCHIVLGQAAAADSWNESAVAMLEELYVHDAPRHANLLAKSLVERSSKLLIAGDDVGARAAQARAIDILQEQLRSQPDHAESQRDLVRFKCGLCGMLQRDGRFEDAESAIREVKELADVSRAITDDERALVSRRAGLLYASMSRPSEAAAELSRAVELTEKVIKQSPSRKILRSQLRDLRTFLCEQLQRAGDLDAVDRLASAAIADADALAPDYPNREMMVADTLSRLAWLAIAANRELPAHAWLERCLALTKSVAPADAFGQAARERALVARRFAAIRDDLRRGAPAEAQAALRSLMPKLRDAEYLLHASCVWVEIARLGPAGDDATRALVESAALDGLRRAVAMGFRDRKRLLACVGLRDLHTRTDFQELLAQLPD